MFQDTLTRNEWYVFSFLLLQFHDRCACFIVTDCHYFFATNKGVSLEAEVSPGKTRSSRNDSTSKQSGRLVSPVHARREFGYCNIQGRDA